jgi:colanic acid/amylovoran biosynthesis glycosyltransferase
MKIAFVVSEFPVLSETFILNQITGLLNRGYEIDIYASKRVKLKNYHPAVRQYQLLNRTYYFYSIPTNLIWRVVKGIGLAIALFVKDPLMLLKAVNILKYGKQAFSLWLLYTAIPQFEKSYDIIHCQFGYEGFRGMAFRSLLAPDAKLITIFRGYDISSFVEKKGAQIYQELFEVGDFFLANCDFFKQRAIQFGCDPKKIQVYRSGLDCDRFAFKARYLPEDGSVRLATTGRLVEKKGIEYVIRAVAKLLPVYPKLEYNIIGDGELKTNLQQLISDLKIDKQVHLLGWKNEKELIEILDRTHIFIAPSVTAKNGDRDAPINVLKEAMAMGMPVISTYHGGITELVEDSISGFLVPERDADAIAEKLKLLLEKPEQWEKMGRAGRAYVETFYNIERLSDELATLYREVMLVESQPKKPTKLLNPAI